MWRIQRRTVLVAAAFALPALLGAAQPLKVTGTKAGYETTTKASAATEKISSLVKLTTVNAKISGTAKVGKTLKVSAGNWGPGAVRLTYRWYRSGKAISGATKTTYKVKSSDKGRTIRITVTGKKSGYPTATENDSVKIK